MTVPALLLAAAILVALGPKRIRARAGVARRGRRPKTGNRSGPDPFAVASTLDVLSVCLVAGMTVPAAASAIAVFSPPQLAALLRRAADLLALGAQPEIAWKPDGIDEDCIALARLARRSASSGSALAQGIAELAEKQRQDASHAAVAAAERAGVLIAAPLGLCFLPAFVCLGIVPVVAGLAGEIFGAALR